MPQHWHLIPQRCLAWRGEGMGLLAFDLDETRLHNSLVGFAIEYQPPGANRCYDLNNRLHFDYNGPRAHQKWFPTSDAPIQKFRWMRVPRDVRKGEYTYRVTPMYKDHSNSPLRKGPTVQGGISLESQTIEEFLNVGLTRGFASS